MLDNDRAEVRPSATSTDDAETDSYPAITEDSRSLLAQAITACDAGEQQRALDTLVAATNRLGDRRWPQAHPAGRALQLTNAACEQAMVNRLERAKELSREAAQLCDAVELDDYELVTDGGEQLTDDGRYKDGGKLRLTDDGLEMPEMLKGYVGQFEMKTASITGQLETTDSGLPDAEFYDGVIAAYPEDGDYNAGISAGELVFQARGYPDTRFRIVDERTEEDSE